VALALGSAPTLGNGGAVAFVSDLSGSGVTSESDRALLVFDGSAGLRAAVREGDLIVDALRVSVLDTALDVNAGGTVAFTASLVRAADGTSAGRGLFVARPEGDVLLAVRDGMLLEIAPGDVRRVSFFGFGGLNDAGDVVFRADFEDGSSGVFVVHPTQVPEPSTALLVLGGAIGLALHSRRRAAGS
jgi:hypothetical protein